MSKKYVRLVLKRTHTQLNQVSIDGPLLSTELRSILNPLVIDVRFVRNLPPLHSAQELSTTTSPNQPMSTTTGPGRYSPTYISYKFPTLERRTRAGTKLAPTPRDFAWDDVHVIFTNQLHETRLREIFIGSPLRIEVHDRDRIMEEENQVKSTLAAKNQAPRGKTVCSKYLFTRKLTTAIRGF